MRRYFVRVAGHSLLVVEGGTHDWSFLCECGHTQIALPTRYSVSSAHRDHKLRASRVNAAEVARLPATATSDLSSGICARGERATTTEQTANPLASRSCSAGLNLGGAA
jgi:hypothetical protein